jgi:hypothetical protein
MWGRGHGAAGRAQHEAGLPVRQNEYRVLSQDPLRSPTYVAGWEIVDQAHKTTPWQYRGLLSLSITTSLNRDKSGLVRPPGSRTSLGFDSRTIPTKRISTALAARFGVICLSSRQLHRHDGAVQGRREGALVARLVVQEDVARQLRQHTRAAPQGGAAVARLVPLVVHHGRVVISVHHQDEPIWRGPLQDSLWVIDSSTDSSVASRNSLWGKSSAIASHIAMDVGLLFHRPLPHNPLTGIE